MATYPMSDVHDPMYCIADYLHAHKSVCCICRCTFRGVFCGSPDSLRFNGVQDLPICRRVVHGGHPFGSRTVVDNEKFTLTTTRKSLKIGAGRYHGGSSV